MCNWIPFYLIRQYFLDEWRLFIDAEKHWGWMRIFVDTEVDKKPSHTDQDLMFDSHHQLEQKPGVIRTYDTRPANWEQIHRNTSLRSFGSSCWTLVKTKKSHRKTTLSSFLRQKLVRGQKSAVQFSQENSDLNIQDRKDTVFSQISVWRVKWRGREKVKILIGLLC